MKSIAVGFVCLLVAGIGVSAQPSADATKAIVKSYLEIQTALASDKFEDVKGPARTLSAQAVALGKEGAALARAATAFASSPDLKAAREAFGPLSDAVIARVQADGSKDVAADLRLAYCPMVKRSWLQREEQVRNPYYGTTMLTCGEIKPVGK
jgi:hypothetical protein